MPRTKQCIPNTENDIVRTQSSAASSINEYREVYNRARLIMSFRPPQDALEPPLYVKPAPTIALLPCDPMYKPTVSRVNLQAPFEEVKSNDDKDECSICLFNVRSAVLVPCGHSQFCYTCIRKRVTIEGTLHCILCNQHVTQVVRPF